MLNENADPPTATIQTIQGSRHSRPIFLSVPAKIMSSFGDKCDFLAYIFIPLQIAAAAVADQMINSMSEMSLGHLIY